MIKFIVILITTSLGFCSIGMAQEKKKVVEVKKETFLKEFSEKACNCIDSLERFDKSKHDLTTEMGICIDKQVTPYHMALGMSKLVEEMQQNALSQLEGKKSKKKNEYVLEVVDSGSQIYTEHYHEIERYLMEHCEALKIAIASDEKIHDKSVSNNPKALRAYDKGIEALKENNFKAALPHFQEAVKIDADFAFAWDNVGICYRNLGEIDKAIDAYKTSLFIEPNGITPLQNLAVAYSLKEDYDNAIIVYQKITKVYPNNPEGFYGLGRVYAGFKNDLEKGLDYMCKAYNLYAEQKSPYRTDAESMIGAIYQEMKEKGKEAKFVEILKKNNISTE